MPVGRRHFCLGDHPVGADQPQGERGDRQSCQSHFRVAYRNARGHFVPVDPEGFSIIRDADQHELVIQRALNSGVGFVSVLEQPIEDLFVVRGNVSGGKDRPDLIRIEPEEELFVLFALDPVVEVVLLDIHWAFPQIVDRDPESVTNALLSDISQIVGRTRDAN